ncbi:retrovirus-related pol polyprotein from transposon TNT 1-94 [Tanacetum coccineum]
MSVEISDLNVSLQEKDLVITALKNELRKLKGKDLADNVVTKHPIAPEMLKVDEQAMILREVVKQGKSQNPLNNPLDSAYCVVQPKGTAQVQHSKLNANSELKCIKCNGCMLSDNHDLCVLDFINNVNACKKSKSVNKNSKRKVWKPTGKVFSNMGYIWKPTGRTFTIVGEACPLTRITTNTEVHIRKPTALENETPKPVVTVVYTRKPRKSKTNVPVSKSKIPKSVSANKKEPSKSWGSIVSDVPSSSLNECRFGMTKTKVSKNSQNRQETEKTSSRVKNESQYQSRISPTQEKKFNEAQIEVQGTKVVKVQVRIGALGKKIKDELSFFLASRVCKMTWKRALIGGVKLGEAGKGEREFGFVGCFGGKNRYKTSLRFFSLLTPPPSVDHPAPVVIAPIADVVAPEPAASTGSPSSTTVNQDAPSPSNSLTTPETQSPIIPNDVEEDNHDIEVVHMGNDPYFGILILEVPSDQSSSMDFIHTIMHPGHEISEHNNKWTKDHPLENIIGELDRPVSTRLQLYEQALFCYYDAFLTAFEPKTYKDALTQSWWIEAMQEELNEFQHLEVWELVPRSDKVMVITLKWNYKVKLDELGGILKNKAQLVARGYRQVEGINFEESFASVAN